MTNMDFTKDVVTLHRGQYLTFVDNRKYPRGRAR